MNKAQSSIEFSLTFVITILIVILTVNLFVWLNHCIVGRQRAFEDSRSIAGGFGKTDQIGDSEFFKPPELKVFVSGGYQK